ncbi:MAG: hypothetical protein IJ733_05830 [Lachnospiraceae bacterium]|nr:hypothetical protein [Lachnospiraceae bacterium]
MFGEKKKPGYIRGIIASIVVIVFFSVIIIVYYNMLRDETESNMMKEGGLNAGISAEKLNGYLSVGMDCISLAGYSLDNMLRGERGAEEMLGYLVDQSFAISNILPEASTGVYGPVSTYYTCCFSFSGSGSGHFVLLRQEKHCGCKV